MQLLVRLVFSSASIKCSWNDKFAEIIGNAFHVPLNYPPSSLVKSWLFFGDLSLSRAKPPVKGEWERYLREQIKINKDLVTYVMRQEEATGLVLAHLESCGHFFASRKKSAKHLHRVMAVALEFAKWKSTQQEENPFMFAHYLDFCLTFARWQHIPKDSMNLIDYEYARVSWRDPVAEKFLFDKKCKYSHFFYKHILRDINETRVQRNVQWDIHPLDLLRQANDVIFSRSSRVFHILNTDYYVFVARCLRDGVYENHTRQLLLKRNNQASTIIGYSKSGLF
jgi:hypothetical protein